MPCWYILYNFHSFENKPLVNLQNSKCSILKNQFLYFTLWVLLWVGLYLSYLIRSINFSFLLDFPKVFSAVNVKQTSWYTSELNY